MLLAAEHEVLSNSQRDRYQVMGFGPHLISSLEDEGDIVIAFSCEGLKEHLTDRTAEFECKKTFQILQATDRAMANVKHSDFPAFQSCSSWERFLSPQHFVRLDFSISRLSPTRMDIPTPPASKLLL
jgi:hypothetical protein